MKLTIFADAGSFLSATGADLEQCEEENNLLLGVAADASGGVSGAESGVFLATVRRDSGGLMAAAVMTPPHLLLLNRAEAVALPPLSDAVRAARWHVPGVFGPAETTRVFAELWTSATGRRGSLDTRMGLYVIRAVANLPAAGGFARPAVAADAEIVATWIAAFHREILSEEIADKAQETARRRIAAGEVLLWDDNGPRAMAASARRTATGVAINAVYTPPEWRGRGFATACVSQLTARLLAEGRAFCVLFADLENPVPNMIYRRIGYRQIAEFAEYRFGGDPSG